MINNNNKSRFKGCLRTHNPEMLLESHLCCRGGPPLPSPTGGGTRAASGGWTREGCAPQPPALSPALCGFWTPQAGAGLSSVQQQRKERRSPSLGRRPRCGHLGFGPAHPPSSGVNLEDTPPSTSLSAKCFGWVQRPFQSLFWDSRVGGGGGGCLMQPAWGPAGSGGLKWSAPAFCGHCGQGGRFLWGSFGLWWFFLLMGVPPCILSTCRVPVSGIG